MASSTSVAPTTVVTLRIGDVLNTSWHLWTKLIGSFGPFYVLAGLPGALLVATPHRPGAALFSGAMGIASIAAGILAFVLYAAVTDAGARVLEGEAPRLGPSFGVALRRFWPLFGAMLLYVLAVMLGMILLVIPGIFVMIALFVVTPACVLERTGPVESLKRSAALTRGAGWRLFGLLLIVFLLAATAPIARVVMLHFGLGTVAAAIGQSVVTAVASLFNACAVLAAYRALADAKDGIGGQRVASVFD
jgi:hypothetical protein